MAPPAGLIIASSPGALALNSIRLMLPLLDYSDKKMCFESIGYADVPQKLEPISEADEKNIIEMLAQELNSSFMTDLFLEVSTVRDSASGDAFCTDDALGRKRFVIIGASHASRLACALEDMGATVIDLSVPGWRADKDTVWRTTASGILSCSVSYFKTP
jgi:hypothetical protein